MAAIIGDIEEHSLDTKATEPSIFHRFRVGENAVRKSAVKLLALPGHITDLADKGSEYFFNYSLYEGSAGESMEKGLVQTQNKYRSWFGITPPEMLDKTDKKIDKYATTGTEIAKVFIPSTLALKAVSKTKYFKTGLDALRSPFAKSAGKTALTATKFVTKKVSGAASGFALKHPLLVGLPADQYFFDGAGRKWAIGKGDDAIQNSEASLPIKILSKDLRDVLAKKEKENMTTEEKNKQTMQPSFENSAKDSSNFLVQTFEKVTGIDMPKSLGGTMESALSGTGSFMDEHPWYSRLFLGVMTYLGVDQLTGDDDNGLSMIMGTIGAFVLPSLLKTAPDGPEQQVAAAPALTPGGGITG